MRSPCDANLPENLFSIPPQLAICRRRRVIVLPAHPRFRQTLLTFNPRQRLVLRYGTMGGVPAAFLNSATSLIPHVHRAGKK